MEGFEGVVIIVLATVFVVTLVYIYMTKTGSEKTVEVEEEPFLDTVVIDVDRDELPERVNLSITGKETAAVLSGMIELDALLTEQELDTTSAVDVLAQQLLDFTASHRLQYFYNMHYALNTGGNWRITWYHLSANEIAKIQNGTGS